MRSEIKRLATEDGRSMNAKIIELLDFALANSGLDIDQIYKLAFNQRHELRDKMADDRKRISELEAENTRLRSRLDLWEPLVLQSTPDELKNLRDRLMSLRAVLDDDEAGELVKDIAPPENLAEHFPSLTAVQKFFEEIRAREDNIPINSPVSIDAIIKAGQKDDKS